MNQITDQLYLGSWQDAKEYKGKPNWSVISVAIDTPFVGDYFYPMTDAGKEPDDLVNFKLAVEKVLQLIDEEKNNVLVHCVAGVNRSPAVIMSALLLMPYSNWWPCDRHLKEVFLYVQKIRPHIDPCTQQLKLACEVAGLEWEKENFQPPVVVLSEHELAVNSLYRIHLNRSADPDGLNHYSYMLASGRRTIEQIEETLITSDEYRKKHS